MPMKPSLSPKPADALVALAVILLALALAASFWTRPSGGALTAVVSVGGGEVERVELSALSSPMSRVYTNNDYTLTVAFSPDSAEVTQADCPNRDCVHSGAVSRPGQSVVCLPARISVALEGSDPSGVDLVIG